MMLMKKKSLLSVLCVLAVISLVCAFPRIAATEPMEVTGMVYASEWDANDKVIGVEIFTSDGDAFAVSNAGKGLELLELVDSVVTATGTVTTDESERKTIRISSYTVIEDSV
ncbi:MAG: hypothetical protein JSU72_12900 [Deltaproteobacteria bacterium]|nr:MAG: hypothetical protein JSU72_12900 [Deltaproteobacteria bacterium]